MDQSVEFKFIAGSTINPYTALLAMDYVEQALKPKDGRYSIIQNGASTAIGQMIARLAARRGIQSFNIVRGAHNAQII